MNFQQVSEEYSRQWKWQQDNSGDYRQYIDCNEIESMILNAAKEKYPQFSDKQIIYIYSRVYQEFHSYFGDCIQGMDEWCEFVANFPKD